MSALDAHADDAGLGPRVDAAIARAVARLRELQHPAGYWQAPVEAAANLEAEYIFLNRLLGRAKPELERSLVERLLALQQDDGGWSLAPGLPSHLSTSIEVYQALKLAGTADVAALGRARAFVLAQGGLARAGLFARFWLACFGQFPWHGVPAFPVEMILAPAWSPVSIYAFSSWTRATLVPFSLLMVHHPQVRISPEAHVGELWAREPGPADVAFPRDAALISRRNAFLLLERTLALLGRTRWRPLRRRAVARAIEWILRHQDSTGQWGGIQPAMVRSVLALWSVGFALDHPAMVRGLQGIDDLLVQLGDQLAYQPCTAPTWDTALAVQALLDAGVEPAAPELARAGEWLTAQQIFRPGDWSVRNPDLDPGGWPVELANDRYPNVDVSAEVVRALAALPAAHGAPAADVRAGRRAVVYGLNWTLGMQGRSGGWAAFDTAHGGRLGGTGLEGLSDPPCADTTGHVLALAGAMGFDTGFVRVRRAVQFLERTQRPDGCWTGRWGVNALYGTSAAMMGLIAVGEDPRGPVLRRALAWLAAHQNADGGFGESVTSYDDESWLGRGESMPSQTAWALLALLAAGDTGSDTVQRAIAYLVQAQQGDGGFVERAFTGTGVPRRSYLRYHLAPLNFALRALGQYRARTRQP